MDLYVLSSHNHMFDDPRFRIVRVYDYKASYGVVLAGHSMKLEKCFREYTKANTEKVFRRIEQNINSLKVRLMLLIGSFETKRWLSMDLIFKNAYFLLKVLMADLTSMVAMCRCEVHYCQSLIHSQKNTHF